MGRQWHRERPKNTVFTSPYRNRFWRKYAFRVSSQIFKIRILAVRPKDQHLKKPTLSGKVCLEMCHKVRYTAGWVEGGRDG